MTAPRRARVAIIAVAAAAMMVGASPGESRAAPDPPLSQLRSSIDGLFSPPKRLRRASRKPRRSRPALPRVNPVPLPQPQPADASGKSAPLAAVPIPPRRPAEQPKADEAPREPPARQPPAAAESPAAPPGPSACASRLTADVAVVQALPPITGPGACGAEDVVRLDAVVTKDGRHIALTPSATLRCTMAEVVAQWVRDVVVPATSDLGGTPRALVVAASYDCRGRNRVTGARLSEHGRANALDVRGLTLADGSLVDFTERTVAVTFRERIRRSACDRFMTVLGPGSDGYHEQHIHLDLIERRGGHRMCEWNIATVPDVASVPLPPERPRTSTSGPK